MRVREHGHDLCTLLALSLALGEEDAVSQVPDVFRRKRLPVLVDFLTQVIQKDLKDAHDRAELLRGPVLEERDDVLEEAVTHLLDELVEDGHEFLDVWVVEGFTLSEADSVDDVEHEKCGVEVRVKSAGLSDHLVGDHGDRLVHDLLEVRTPHVVPHGLQGDLPVQLPGRGVSGEDDVFGPFRQHIHGVEERSAREVATCRRLVPWLE